MMVSDLCPDDLLLAARRGDLSALNDAKLEFHLQRCARCRATLEVGRAFDSVLGARPGDDAVASSIAARMTEPRSKRRLAWAVAGGVVLSGSLAAAAVTGVDVARLFEKASDQTAQRTPRAIPNQAPASERGPQPPRAIPPEVPPPATRAPAPQASAPQLNSAPVGAAAASWSAPELFREANHLRSQGQVSEAQQKYKQLQATFPRTTEARVSLVSLGRLELGAKPAAALRHFDAYLGQSAHRTLAEEALFGRASALGRLGRSAEERAAWQDLLTRFPGSVYAQQARTRLSTAP